MAADEEEYEYYDEEECEYGNGGDDEYEYEYYDDTQIITTRYSQQLIIDPDSVQEPQDMEDEKALDSFSAHRSKTHSRHHSHRNSDRKQKQSPNMLAIHVIKALFKNENLNQLCMQPQAQELENLAQILENIINKNTTEIPDFILHLFQTTIDNMFGVLNLDFNLLNYDYLHIKSVFVDENGIIRFERIMNLCINSKISTIQISNIHLTSKSFDCILNYISNDANYDQEDYLQNAVNQFILHRKSGLKYDKIESIYAQQFEVCGWKMSFDAQTQHVIIKLDFHASWEYYDEDYEEEEEKEKENGIVTNSHTTLTKEATHDDEYEYYEDDEYEYYYENETEKVNKPSPMLPNKTALKAPASADVGVGIGGGLGGLGLPPPDSEDEVDIETLEKNKVKFLSEVLTNPDYEQRALFSGILSAVISAMQRMDVRKGQCIIKETEYGQNYDLKFFVIEYGVFSSYQQGKKLDIELFSTSTFGETHLIYGIPQHVTIRAATNKCLVWYLKRSIYYQISWKYFHKTFKNRLKTKLNEFNMITTLGTGSFGKVVLVRDPTSNKTYSLKKIAKNNVIKNGQQKHIMNERSVMALINHKKKDKKNRKQNTFCCKLYGLYQDPFYLYFLMEPLLGGELFTLLRHNKKFSEKVTRFYLSCIVVAFDHLHSHNIIYRDIKPENIMLQSNGYCVLVDFGLSKMRNNTVTLCGTPEYLAPEVIQNYWQGFELDFWGLGILAFEMINGKTPFASYEQILRGKVPKLQSNNVELNDLISNLLVKNPYQRLGTTANKRKGVEDIYQHSWFKGKMKWNALKAQRFRPPYIPDIENDEDDSHFDDVDSDDDRTTKKNETYINNDPSLYKWCEYF